MSVEKELFISEIVEHNETKEVGVVIKINAKTIKVAFGDRVQNMPKGDFTASQDKTILDVKVVDKNNEDVGTFGYLRLDANDKFTKENLEKGTIQRCVITNKNRSETTIASYGNVNSTIATVFYVMNVGYVKTFFSQTLVDLETVEEKDVEAEVEEDDKN